MDRLEMMRQRIAADIDKKEKFASERNVVSGEIDDLEARIKAAVDSGDVDAAEKLLTEQNAKKTRLVALDRICSHNDDPQRYMAELVEINDAKIAEYQKSADKAAADMAKAHKAYIEKKLALTHILYDAARSRADCASLAGIGALYGNPLADKFNTVSHDRHDMDLSWNEKDMILAMDDHFLEMVGFINEFCTFK